MKWILSEDNGKAKGDEGVVVFFEICSSEEGVFGKMEETPMMEEEHDMTVVLVAGFRKRIGR